VKHVVLLHLPDIKYFSEDLRLATEYGKKRWASR